MYIIDWRIVEILLWEGRFGRGLKREGDLLVRGLNKREGGLIRAFTVVKATRVGHTRSAERGFSALS